MNYKVGDRVKIQSLAWYNEHALIDTSGVFRTSIESLCLNKKRFMGKELTICSVLSNRHYLMEETGALRWTDEMIEGLAEEEVGLVDNFSSRWVNEFNLPEGYIFKDENGNVINATKIVLEKKKKEYPKTYEECCKVLYYAYEQGITMRGVTEEEEELFRCLILLKRCRDAYWKIAGEEMGLGKPWEPDFRGVTTSYVITVESGKFLKSWTTKKQVILTFPTEEMRDAFYENFKSEIESCKELL
jgi:hypothetical protein